MSTKRSDKPRQRRHTPRISNRATAVIAAAALIFVGYLVFGGSLPFQSSPFALKAVFTANTDLHIPSPVRIAGVQVGEVTGVQRIEGSPDAGLVTMQIDSNGLPIHSNATAKIRSRIFLEGNFYVELQPGSPSAPLLHSGATLPAANTSGPVQLDRILSSLNSAARTNLQTLVRGLGSALNQPPTAIQDSSQTPPEDPSVQGLTGAQALNLNLRYSAGAFEASAIVNQALLGEAPHDLSGVVAGGSKVFRALGSNQAELASLVTSFNSTMAALGAHQQALSASIAELPALLRSADAANSALDGAFGPTRAFASAILPGIRELGPTIDVAIPWLQQLTALSSQSELGGLLTDLTPAVKDTASALSSTTTLVRQSNLLAQCFINAVIPTGNEVIQDPPQTTGLKLYQELFQAAVGVAGASQNFDGNGRYLRTSVAGGSELVQTKQLPLNGPLFGNAVLSPLGTRPAFPTAAPQLRNNVACYKNAAPKLNSAGTGAGP